MRTTVTIADGLLELAKQRARSRGQTLGELIEESLHHYLTRPAPSGAPELPVFDGDSGFVAGVDPTSNASLFEAADAAERDGHGLHG